MTSSTNLLIIKALCQSSPNRKSGASLGFPQLYFWASPPSWRSMLPFLFVGTSMGSSLTCSGYLAPTDTPVPSESTYFWEITLIGGYREWSACACCWPTKSSTRMSCTCCGGTMRARLLTKYMGFTMNVNVVVRRLPQIFPCPVERFCEVFRLHAACRVDFRQHLLRAWGHLASYDSY